MKSKLLSLVVALFIIASISAQGLKINSGSIFKTSGSINVVLQNADLINNGNGDFSNCNIYLTGNTQNNIGGSSATTMSNLYINKNSSTVFLQSDLNVTNNVVFQNGLVDLNNHNLLLSPAGLLVNESEENHVIGSLGGYVSITVDLNTPAAADPGNLGAVITSSKDMGSVLIQRGHNSQTNNGSGKSILRYYNIKPTNNTALNATFDFHYLDAELNGITENGLVMWKSSDGGATWTKIGTSTQNLASNYVEANNVNAFSMYTLNRSSFSFSGMLSDNMQANKISSVMLTPNPASLQCKVSIIVSETFNSELNVYAADGKKVIQQPVSLHAGINQVTIDVNTLSNGVYYVALKMSNGLNKTISFTKQ